jgi:hypothetical protein
VRVGNGADETRPCEIAHAVDRVDDVDITLEPDPIEVDRDVAHEHIARSKRGWQLAILCASGREWHLGARMQGRTRQNREATVS